MKGITLRYFDLPEERRRECELALSLPRVFFIAWYIRDSQQHDSAPRLSDDQLAALALVENIANDPAFHIEMEFRPGDVQLLNNATVLHAREAYADDDEPHRRRHLLRLWLTTDTPQVNELLRGGIPTNSTELADEIDNGQYR